MKSKRAVSGVIVSILLVLLAITTVSMVSVYVRKQVQLSQHFSCVDLKIDLPITIKKACFNQSSGDLGITLERKIGSQLSSVELQIINGSSSSNYEIGENCQTCEMIKEGEVKTYYINQPAQTVSSKIEDCLLETLKVNNC